MAKRRLYQSKHPTFRYKTGLISQLEEDSLQEESHLNFNSVITSPSGANLNGNLPDNQQIISFTLTGITRETANSYCFAGMMQMKPAVMILWP